MVLLDSQVKLETREIRGLRERLEKLDKLVLMVQEAKLVTWGQAVLLDLEEKLDLLVRLDR